MGIPQILSGISCWLLLLYREVSWNVSGIVKQRDSKRGSFEWFSTPLGLDHYCICKKILKKKPNY